MPNFHTHWLVALGAIDAAPKSVQLGWRAWQKASLTFATNVRNELDKVDDAKKAKAWKAFVEEESRSWHLLVGARGTAAPRDHWYSLGRRWNYCADRDDVSAFSAYMLGACGPDFWTVLSEPVVKIPDAAGEQFNLGHYNRTFRQFQASVRAVGRDASVQSRVQKAYFSGMATHFAADLVIHELVNLSAGAYNLTKQVWFSEQADGFTDRLKKWTMHNKVEHYWDTLIRYKYFGDRPDLAAPYPVLGAPGKEPTPQNFLTQVGLLERIKAVKSEAARKALRDIVATDAFKYLVEKPLLFPFQFCDRVRERSGLEPFIYDVVITQAHPQAEVHPVIFDERTSHQMKDGKGGRTYSETNKLRYFSSELNDDAAGPYSLNYLTYVVCPSFQRASQFGGNLFFDSTALPLYLDGATRQARDFLTELLAAYDGFDGNQQTALDAVRLSKLGRFWNLDTGLGLEVRGDVATTPAEVVTTLDFVHVLDGGGAGALTYRRPPRNQGYLHHFDGEVRFGASPAALFPLRPTTRFPSWADVMEPDDTKFLPRLLVGPPASRALQRLGDSSLDAYFFDGQATKGSGREQAASAGAGQGVTVEARKMAKRLTLVMRIRIPQLGAAPEELALSLHSDAPRSQPTHAENAGAPTYLAKEITEEWLVGADPLKTDARRPAYLVRLVDFQPGVAAESYLGTGGTPMQRFSTALLANLNATPVGARDVKKGTWNNVVPTGWSGRNFAIGTGRKWILHSTRMAEQPFAPWVEGSVDPQLELFADPSPTEQIFFTLFVLAKQPDGKVWDVLGQKEVTKADMPAIRRIDAAGFVKIVLYYVVTLDGVSQLEACHVDGVEVPVATDLAGR